MGPTQPNPTYPPLSVTNCYQTKTQVNVNYVYSNEQTIRQYQCQHVVRECRETTILILSAQTLASLLWTTRSRMAILHTKITQLFLRFDVCTQPNPTHGSTHPIAISVLAYVIGATKVRQWYVTFRNNVGVQHAYGNNSITFRRISDISCAYQ